MFWELGNGLVLTETKDAWQLFGDDRGTVEGAWVKPSGDCLLSNLGTFWGRGCQWLWNGEKVTWQLMVLELILHKRTEWDKVQIKELEEEMKRESLCMSFLRGRQVVCRDSCCGWASLQAPRWWPSGACPAGKNGEVLLMFILPLP